jgi:hypothetical protein
MTVPPVTLEKKSLVGGVGLWEMGCWLGRMAAVNLTPYCKHSGRLNGSSKEGIWQTTSRRFLRLQEKTLA